MIEGSNEAQNAVQSLANAAHTMPLRHFSTFCPRRCNGEGARHKVLQPFAVCAPWPGATLGLQLPFRTLRGERYPEGEFYYGIAVCDSDGPRGP